MALYNNPNVTPSTIDEGSQALNGTGGRYAGEQVRIDHIIKKALVDARRKDYFSQTADTKSMPKHMGKVMKQYFYVPLLDDRNLSTEGLGNNSLVSGEASAGAAGSGALYQGSKEVGTISGKMPLLGEEGGRVNRIGFTRELREGSIEKYGMFTEYTQDDVDFDSDAELYDHMYTEMMNGAHEITEDLLQIDLITNAGTVKYAATGDASGSGRASTNTLVSYDDLQRLSMELDQNRTPRSTKIITGSRMIDSKTVGAVRYIYCGTELLPTLRRMVDLHGNPAWIPVEQYAATATLAMGEEGAIGQFRFVIPPEMMHWADAGAAVATECYYDTYNDLMNAGATEDGTVGAGDDVFVSTSGVNADVFPMLCIGDGSYSTIGFQTSGSSVKFKIISKKPGASTADSYNDPYGEKGFVSLKFWYGFLLQRPERLAIINTLALQ